MTYYNIVSAVFSYFFKDLNVLPAVLFTISYLLPNFSYFKLVLIPSEQDGFRKHRNTTEQVLDLTINTESGYEQKLMTGAVFIDLPAAYETVWYDGP